MYSVRCAVCAVRCCEVFSVRCCKCHVSAQFLLQSISQTYVRFNLSRHQQPGSPASPPHILTATFCPHSPAFLANKHPEPRRSWDRDRGRHLGQHCHSITHLLEPGHSPPHLTCSRKLPRHFTDTSSMCLMSTADGDTIPGRSLISQGTSFQKGVWA